MPRLLLAALLCLATPCLTVSASDDYEIGNASRDGIGKFYQGREISQVMGHRGAGWLERSSREREERTDLLLRSLGLQAGDVVVDLGAGTGYFSLPMAQRVGVDGRVLAVDIQPQMLALVEQRMAAEGISNVEPVLATETDPKLPEREVDLVLMVDAYHEFSYPREVMAGVVQALDRGGRVVLVEYRGEDPSVPIKPLHKMTVAQAKRELGAAGLSLVKLDDSLPLQHIMIFRRASEDAGE